MKLLRVYVRMGGFVVLLMVMLASLALFALTANDFRREIATVTASQAALSVAVLAVSAVLVVGSVVGIRRLAASPGVRWT